MTYSEFIDLLLSYGFYRHVNHDGSVVSYRKDRPDLAYRLEYTCYPDEFYYSWIEQVDPEIDDGFSYTTNGRYEEILQKNGRLYIRDIDGLLDIDPRSIDEV